MMWTRKELKERAKEALKRNYWKIVLVSLIAILIGGGLGSAAGSGHGNGSAASESFDQGFVEGYKEAAKGDVSAEEAAGIALDLSKLRAKLSEDANAYIRTIRGLGYRLEKKL